MICFWVELLKEVIKLFEVPPWVSETVKFPITVNFLVFTTIKSASGKYPWRLPAGEIGPPPFWSVGWDNWSALTFLLASWFFVDAVCAGTAMDTRQCTLRFSYVQHFQMLRSFQTVQSSFPMQYGSLKPVGSLLHTHALRATISHLVASTSALRCNYRSTKRFLYRWLWSEMTVNLSFWKHFTSSAEPDANNLGRFIFRFRHATESLSFSC